MFQSNWLRYAAFRGWLTAILVFLPVSPYAQQQSKETAPPIIHDEAYGERSVIEPPHPINRATKPAAELLLPALPVKNKPTANPAAAALTPTLRVEYKRPTDSASEQRKKGDLSAQQSMANSAGRMVVIAWGQLAAVLLALLALGLIFEHTRETARAAKQSADAAQKAVAVALKQADAAILVEAAKIVATEIYLAPPYGDGTQEKGIPMDGYTPRITLKNIGKTSAFLTNSAVIMTVSPMPPEQLFPSEAQETRPDWAGVEANKTFQISYLGMPIALSMDERTAIKSRETYLWVSGCVWFKDWFGIDRKFTFRHRWKCDPLTRDDGPLGKAGFLPHNEAR